MTPHGSYSTYTNHNCRCVACTGANAERQQSATAARRDRLRRDPASVPHGTMNAYGNYGCRCDECKGARRKAGRRQRAEWNTSSKENQMQGEPEYVRAYERAINGVKAAVRQGLITVPDPALDGEERVILRVAEHFMVSLGTNVH